MFTTFEVVIESQQKKIDLVTGKVVEYKPGDYVDVHTQPAIAATYNNASAAPAQFDGMFPCVYASFEGSAPGAGLGECAMPTTHSQPVNRFEADLRYGNFVMRQTDLYLSDIFDVPLTRTYSSGDWVHPNPVHAFGKNTNHPYDIAPLGSRNPYTYQMIALEDGDYLYFDRISKGTGYADAVYQHTETSTNFYKATQRWNGSGWTTQLADGSMILFPESYNATNMAQGAPIEMRDAQGNKLQLQRDGARNLLEIRTPNGATIAFSYDSQARIVHAQDSRGNSMQYTYNAAGMLTDAVSSSGSRRHYDYEGVKMTAIQDENGRVLVRNWYDRGKLVRQQFQNGDAYAYEYHNARGAQYAESVVVTLPNGSRQTVYPGNSVPNDYKHPQS